MHAATVSISIGVSLFLCTFGASSVARAEHSTPSLSAGCERPLVSWPPRGPAGAVVELTGECQPIHSGARASVHFDDVPIGYVSGETGGDYQNLVQIPRHASVGSHVLRLAGFMFELPTTFEVTQARPCIGDCDGDGRVAVDEIILGVNILLSMRPLDACMPFDASGDGAVSIAELIAAIGGGVAGCIAAAPFEALAGTYAVYVSEATDFSPGAVQTFEATVTASPEGALLIEFPYWPGIVDAVASPSFDGSVALHGSIVLDDGSASPVAGTGFVSNDPTQRWLSGTLVLDRFGRTETINFVMRDAGT